MRKAAWFVALAFASSISFGSARAQETERADAARPAPAASKGKNADQADLATLNSELESSLGRLRVGKPKGEKGLRWEWEDDTLRLENPLGPVARSAADLLTHDDAVRQVGQCHGDNCGWLFVDLSKNHSRRWCDMRDCGNRAKIRRFRSKSC